MRSLGLDRPSAVAANEDELAKARRDRVVNAVAATLATTFNRDPLFPSQLSRLMSASGSLVKKHGLLIEDDLAHALERNHLHVERKQYFSITRKGLKAVSKGRDRANGGRQLPFDANDQVREIEIDIFAIDETNKWAVLISSKRGGGLTDSKKRKAHERELRALDLVILDQLRARYPNLESACVCIIDYLGQSGFSEDITLRRHEIDSFFGLSIVKVLDDTSLRLRTAIRDAFGPLVAEAWRIFNPHEADDHVGQSSAVHTMETVRVSASYEEVACVDERTDCLLAREPSTVAPIVDDGITNDIGGLAIEIGVKLPSKREGDCRPPLIAVAA